MKLDNIDNKTLIEKCKKYIGSLSENLLEPIDETEKPDLLFNELLNRFNGKVRVNDTAETIYVDHPQASYGIFCFNSKGDLFINSDWGFYGYAWRSFSGSFKDFLRSSNADYIIGKLAINYNQDKTSKNWLTGRRKEKLEMLITEFLQVLNSPENIAVIYETVNP